LLRAIVLLAANAIILAGMLLFARWAMARRKRPLVVSRKRQWTVAHKDISS
jgi:hypothetical protein